MGVVLLTKNKGGLGIKDLKAQGMALASKWIIQALSGEEQWKVLVRNDISRLGIKKGKWWNNVPLCNKMLGNV